MNIDELKQVLAQGPASLCVESYISFGSSMIASLDVERGPSLTVGLGFCAQFSGAFQGKRERLSVETSDEGGWKIVGDTTMVSFGRLTGVDAERVPEALAVASGVPQRLLSSIATNRVKVTRWRDHERARGATTRFAAIATGAETTDAA